MNDGTILPHYLQVRRTNPTAQDSVHFEDIALRVGEVVKVHPPDDPVNRNKQVTEYTVRCLFREGNGPMVTRVYRATAADAFGTAADSHHFTYRAATGDKGANQPSDGARVLLACANGESNSAVILSGVVHPKAEKDGVRVDGLGYRFRYNGVSIQINDAGELAITVSGATANDGSPRGRDPHNHGTQVQIRKDGTFQLMNQSGESVTIDATKHKIAVQASGDVQITAGGTLYLGSPKAQENIVLGKQLTAALAQLVQTLLKAAPTFGTLGPSPVALHPTLAAGLSAWLAQFATPTAPYLSQTKFTEP